MSIHNKMWLFIFSVITISLVLNIPAYNNKKKLKQLIDKTGSLERRVTTLTSFRAASRQSMLELTEYLYTRKPKNKTEYEASQAKAAELIKNLKEKTLESKDEIAPIDELVALHLELTKKIKVLLYNGYRPYSQVEINEQEQALTFFHLVLVKKITVHLDLINGRLEGALKLYRSTSTNMARMMLALTGTLSIFVILFFVLVEKSTLRRLSKLNKAMSEFEPTTTTTTTTTRNDEISKLVESFDDLTLRIKSAKRQLDEARIFSDLLLDNIPNMVFVKDARELNYVRINKAAEVLFGDSQGVVGKNDYDFFPKSQADFFTKTDRDVFRGGKIFDIPEEPVLARLKGERIVHTIKVPVFDENKNPLYLLGISEDITEKIDLVKARLAQQAAEDMAKQKSKFLDIAAHELRTPITVISMMLQVAEKQTTKGRPLTIDVLARIQAPVKRLTRLIVDLLEMSRLERGLVVLAPVQTDLVSLISGYLEEFRVQAPERSFLFNKNVQSIEINIDPIRVGQVLSNLLDNAVKYSGDGEIEITLEDMPNVTRVSVADHGAGIPKEQQAVLFHAFSRGSTDAVIRESGLGLGLSICHGIISLHGGTIGVMSEEGKGATFYFELPKKEIKT